jgi:hypothetical protein
MELFLNLLWLLISGAALALWQVRWKHEQSFERWPGWQAPIALVCVLVLLFFPISLTDDLHAEILLSGDCSAQRRSMTAFADGHKHQAPASRGAEPVVFQDVLHLVPSYALYALMAGEIPSPYLLLAREINDRAPPLSPR